MNVGVLALQGGVSEHIKHIEKLNHKGILVKKVEDLEFLDAIILPGGESTTVSKLLKITGLDVELKKRIKGGLKTWGTCAGMILLANELEDNEKPHLGVLDIKVKRNGFGSQINSFKQKTVIEEVSEKEIEVVFIRAPYITKVGKNVNILCTIENYIVAVRKENVVATAFHPELTEDTSFLEYFLKI